MTVRLRAWRRGRVVRSAVWVLTTALALATPGSGLAFAAPVSQGTAMSASLTVTSDPGGAAVYVDGRFRGRTPLTLDRVALGDHRVNVQKDGYLENSRVVAVSQGEAEDVNVRLTPATPARYALLQVEPEPGTYPPPRTPAPVAERQGGGGKGLKLALIGLGVVGAGVGAYFLLSGNSPPTPGTIDVSHSIALMAATSVTFRSVGASDKDNDPLTYEWDFGDGSTGAGETASHVYQTEGPFTVRLTVSDKKKSAEAAAATVTVRSMNGTWVGSYGGRTRTWAIEQSGTRLTGTYRHSSLSPILGIGTVEGTVSDPVNVTIRAAIPRTEPFTYTATLDATLDTMEGRANGSGFVNAPMTFRRQ